MNAEHVRLLDAIRAERLKADLLGYFRDTDSFEAHRAAVRVTDSILAERIDWTPNPCAVARVLNDAAARVVSFSDSEGCGMDERSFAEGWLTDSAAGFCNVHDHGSSE